MSLPDEDAIVPGSQINSGNNSNDPHAHPSQLGVIEQVQVSPPYFEGRNVDVSTNEPKDNQTVPNQEKGRGR